VEKERWEHERRRRRRRRSEAKGWSGSAE